MGEKCPGTAQPCACFAYYAKCRPGDASLMRKGAECNELNQHAHIYLGEECSSISSAHRKITLFTTTQNGCPPGRLVPH